MVAGGPLGTHLSLCHLLERRLSGRLLQSRGAVIRDAPILGFLRMPSGAAGRLWRRARGTPSSCRAPGSHASVRQVAFRHTNMGAIAWSPVMWSDSFVRVFRLARPSTTRPQRARRYRPSPWVSRSELDRSARRVWPCPASWCGARGPLRAQPPGKPACSQRSRCGWQTTKRSSAIGGFP
jgi:hypothetical protein